MRDGVLDGSLVIHGSGDPTLVIERLWLLLRRVQQLGVREIRGDIVLDRSAFASAAERPGDFDGEPLRPYNVQPDALLLNYKSVIYGFVPDAGARRGPGAARAPTLDGAPTVDRSVPLAAGALRRLARRAEGQLRRPRPGCASPAATRRPAAS